MILLLYRAFTSICSPLLRMLLRERVEEGKEIASRVPEKWGYASMPRPPGKLLWLHAASVGELQSILPLMQALLKADSDLHILLTTITVTSSQRFDAQRLGRTIHQFLPLDTPAAVSRFLAHWRPDGAFLTESEIWPNLVMQMKKSVPVCGILNGRMSDKSFRFWNFIPHSIASLLNGLTIYAQSEKDAEKYRKLGGLNVQTPGNLKFDAPPLLHDEKELQLLQDTIGARPVWIAASTHPEEEPEIMEYLHPRLKKTFPDLLTIIVPRHPQRGDLLSSTLAHSALRSRREPITEATEYYIADTIGELGLFYRLCNIVFMGGSLIAHGGQNMLEPARLGCAVLWGPHIFNFEDAAAMLIAKDAGRGVRDAGELADQLELLLGDPNKAAEMGARGRQVMEAQSGITQRVAGIIMNTMQAKLAAL